MNGRLFLATLHQRRTSMVWYAVGLASYSAFLVWYFTLVPVEDVKAMLEQLPPEMMQFLAGSGVSMTSFGGYLAYGWLGLMWVALIAAAAIGFSASALAGEVGGGTMELLLSTPVGRRTLVMTRIAAMATFLAVQLLATMLPIGLTAWLLDIELSLSHLWLVTALGYVLALAIGALAMLASSVSRSAGRPAAFVGSLLGVMWLLHFMAAQAGWADALEPINLFSYWSPAGIIDAGEVAASAWVVLTAVAVLGSGASVLLFARRDVA